MDHGCAPGLNSSSILGSHPVADHRRDPGGVLPVPSSPIQKSPPWPGPGSRCTHARARTGQSPSRLGRRQPSRCPRSLVSSPCRADSRSSGGPGLAADSQSFRDRCSTVGCISVGYLLATMPLSWVWCLSKSCFALVLLLCIASLSQLTYSPLSKVSAFCKVGSQRVARFSALPLSYFYVALVLTILCSLFSHSYYLLPLVSLTCVDRGLARRSVFTSCSVILPALTWLVSLLAIWLLSFLSWFFVYTSSPIDLCLLMFVLPSLPLLRLYKAEWRGGCRRSLRVRHRSARYARLLYLFRLRQCAGLFYAGLVLGASVEALPGVSPPRG